MKNSNEIRTAENPLRYEIRNNGYIYLLQLDEDEINLTVIKSKDSYRAKTKAEILYDGDASDFAVNNKALLEYEQIYYKKALVNYLNINKVF